jgi:hypothetical protein
MWATVLKLPCIFVISAPYQRCYSDYPARGIQWPSGSKPGMTRARLWAPFLLTPAEHSA